MRGFKGVGVIKKLSVVLCSVVAATTTTLAGAEPPAVHHVANIKFHQGAWTYHPIYTYVNNMPQVDSVLALAAVGSTTGSNLAGVWYLRQDTGWETKSWDSTSPYKIIKSVKSAVNIPDIYDGYWAVPRKSAIATATSAGNAIEYHKGVLASDTLSTWIESQANRDEIVEALTSVGWKSADIVAEKVARGTGNCDEKSVMTGIAAATEYAYLTGSHNGPAVATAYTMAVAGSCGVPGPKQSVVMGGERWTDRPYPENLTPMTPVRDKCDRGPDGILYCTYNEPGDWIEHRWCLRFLPDDEVGPPQPLCEQTRNRGRCNRPMLCVGDVAPAVPPCEYGPFLDCFGDDGVHSPWVPDAATSCPDCPTPTWN